MTKFSNDDKNLVNFLRQHRPEVPPAATDLEQQILQNVETLHLHQWGDVCDKTKRLRDRRPTSLPTSLERRRPLWLVPSAVAASLVAAVVGYQALIPPPPNAAELAKLERFMETNWQGAISTSPDGDSLAITEPVTD